MWLFSLLFVKIYTYIYIKCDMNTKMKTIQHFNSKIQNILIENNNDI